MILASTGTAETTARADAGCTAASGYWLAAVVSVEAAGPEAAAGCCGAAAGALELVVTAPSLPLPEHPNASAKTNAKAARTVNVRMELNTDLTMISPSKLCNNDIRICEMVSASEE